jgi:hypothetical protein
LQSVISISKLALLISMGLVYLLGQGWLAVGPILHGSLTTSKNDVPLLYEVPLALVSGLIINYGIVLCFQSLKISLVVGCILSVLGISCFAVYVFQRHTQQISTLTTMNKWLGIIVVCLLFLSPIMAQPLNEWDARSIWFFHAKMIYVAGTFDQSAGWQDPSVAFSHRDYPNLVPVLGAQVAYVIGFWNEYIPKVSLFFMFVPVVIWLFTFARRSYSFAILLLLIPFSLYSFIWSGMMDGYLALYFSIVMLLLGRYIKSSQPIDLISSLCCSIALLYIKNEGALAALIGLCLIVLVYFLKSKSYSVKDIFKGGWKYLPAGLIALLPFVLWSLYKQRWGLSNDLEIGATQSLPRIFSRLNDGSYKLVLQSLYEQIEGALLLLGLLYFVSLAWDELLAKESLPAFIAAGLYSLGVMIIYLLTPNDLAWQLNASASRIMLSANGCIFIGCYYILNTLENNQGVQ